MCARCPPSLDGRLRHLEVSIALAGNRPGELLALPAWHEQFIGGGLCHNGLPARCCWAPIVEAVNRTVRIVTRSQGIGSLVAAAAAAAAISRLGSTLLCLCRQQGRDGVATHWAHPFVGPQQNLQQGLAGAAALGCPVAL